MKKQDKLYQVEFMRFIFSALIVYFHILHANIMKYVGESAARYEMLAAQSKYASCIVECFLILAGYFFYYSFWKNSKQSLGEFAYKKISRLWPVLAFSIFVGIAFFRFKWYPQLFNLLFLQCIGVSLEYQGINWYISPFFFVLLFYFALLRYSKDRKKTSLLIAVLVYFSYVLNIEKTGGGFGRETVYGVFNLGVFRAIAGIGLGYLLAAGVQTARERMKIKKIQLSKFQEIAIMLIISVVEIGCLILLLSDFLCAERAYGNQFIVVILFSIFLICMVSCRGIFSKIFNRKFFGIWGRYAYSIYVMQQTAFFILQRTLWKNSSFVENHAYRCLAVSVLFSVFMGIVVYYVVEQPAAKIFAKVGKSFGW